MKRIVPGVLCAALVLMLTMQACSNEEPAAEKSILSREYARIESEARDTTVRFYMYGGFANVNTWIDGWVAPRLKERYGITLRRVPMDASVFMNKLMTEKAAGREEGSIDLLWINGENFKNAMQAGLLLGPITPVLPNFARYVNEESVRHDFGYPTRGYEAPYGRAQFVFEYDSARTPEPPTSFEALRKWVREHPGRFTYPMPPDFTGSAFIRQALYAVSGGHEQYMAGFDPDVYEPGAMKLWMYLNALKPHLWQQGRSYPADSASLDTLFARGEVDLNMSYHPAHAQSKIADGVYPESVRTFVMEEGSIFNTHFTAVPANAPNPAGALVTANFLLSPEAQLAKFDPRNWGDFPAIDLTRLPQEWREKFEAVDLGPATIPPGVLARSAVPEIPSRYLEALESGWEEHVGH